MHNLKEKITGLPQSAGVYWMKDGSGKIIYIGKAKSLKKRLMTYLTRRLDAKTIALMSRVCDIECRPCASESMALLLEASLIRKYKPKYNVSLRDDKSFPLVKITDEEFPLIYITRKRKDDGAVYLGPYTDVKSLRQALKIIRRLLPYRSCRKLPKKACIYYRLKACHAPCIGKISRQGYAESIEGIRMILEGKVDALIQRLSAELKLKSAELKFEEAAVIRDQMEALNSLVYSRSISASHDELEGLKELLKLPKLPRRIEAFDISNISGKEATGSMVSFYRGRADKNNYRRFRVKTIKGIDDYAMLREIIRRRISRLLAQSLPLPDLVLIDGGRGHLLAAMQEAAGLGLVGLPLVSIAKDRENIYTKDSINPINLSADTPALNLIRRIRDEAHRFAISYHHVLRRKKIIGR